jgi:hypothetical protein
LDIVRPLCAFAAQLPAYTQKTKRLSPQALAVRNALMSAREPATLLFDQLPDACGFQPFPAEADRKKGKEVRLFVESLKGALDDLRMAYPQLQDRMKYSLSDAFDLSGDLNNIRSDLARRGENVLIAVNEPQLKAFCLRLSDHALTDPAWLESLGSFVCSLPPSKWTDLDEDRYRQELGHLCARFRRVESIAFGFQKKAGNEYAMRVAITQLDGSEVDNVIYVQKNEEGLVAEIEAEIALILNRTKRIGLAATARAFWNALSIREEEAPTAGGETIHPHVIRG